MKKIIVLCAMGLALYIASSIASFYVVYLGLAFDRSKIDSGWSQAIGSFAALGVSLFVMHRQNKKASELIVDADKLGLRRRAAAVRAQVEYASGVVDRISRHVSTMLENSARDPLEFGRALRYAEQAIDEIINVIKSIPTHELGSYPMAKCVLGFGLQLTYFSKSISAMSQNPISPHDDAIRAFKEARAALQRSLEAFKQAEAEFER